VLCACTAILWNNWRLRRRQFELWFEVVRYSRILLSSVMWHRVVVGLLPVFRRNSGTCQPNDMVSYPIRQQYL
jgi:hypothetical protein